MALGYGSRRATSGGEFQSGRGAQMLAGAFDAACREAEPTGAALGRLMRAADSTAQTVAMADVSAVAPAFALGPVAPKSALHQPLLEMLFAHDGPRVATPGTSEWLRGQSLALCLAAAAQAGGSVSGTPAQVLRRVIRTGVLARDRAFAVEPIFQTTFAGLQRLYERHWLQLALYGLWRDVVSVLSTAPQRSHALTTITARLHADVRAGPGYEVAKRWLGEDPLDAPLSTLLRGAANRRKRAQANPWRFSEERLAKAIAAGATTTKDAVAAPAFALLLTVIEDWQRRSKRDDVPHATWHADGGRDRLSLEVVCADAHARADLTGADYLAWMLRAYVVGQSLRATVAKGPQARTGEYVYFIVPDSGGYRLGYPPTLRSYLQIDSPRLIRALSFLEQLGLVTSTPAFNITAAGRTLLRQVTKAHQAAALAPFSG
ncbi:hypothetical protein [Gemmatimonas sp.]|uniref:hypothetical protein n=1 Tax=Gemmatimonas sp. TaxID=1962908 RepID=UPI003F704BEC